MSPRPKEDEDLHDPPVGNEEDYFNPRIGHVSPADRKFCAELMAFLEDEGAIDPKRVQLFVRGGNIALQGSVNTHEERRHVETLLRDRPGVTEVESRLSVQNMHEWEDDS